MLRMLQIHVQYYDEVVIYVIDEFEYWINWRLIHRLIITNNHDNIVAIIISEARSCVLISSGYDMI